MDTLSIREELVSSKGNLCYHSLNWLYLYDSDVFFKLTILIRILDLISDPNQSRDSYILIKLDTLSIREGFFCQWELMLPFNKLAISLWFRCFLQINDFDSDSRPHFRSESFQRFIYSNKIGYFVHKRRVSKVQWELVLPFTKMGISLWFRCFLSIFDFDSDSRPYFISESVQRFIYFIKLDTLSIWEGFFLSMGISVTIH